MDENFSINWGEDTSTVVQNEEVICNIENEIIPGETEEFTGVTDDYVEEDDEIQEDGTTINENIVYITTDDNKVLLMQTSDEVQQQQLMDVTEEEIITSEHQWDESCPEEIIIGSEEAISCNDIQQNEDFDIPLPTDQDEYTAARPYPCDFCSRRFRKKANLMNHMVAHQTDRPHGCNLCGVRYIRKCDLMNHLKIHAYVPETDHLDEEDDDNLDDNDFNDTTKRSKRKIRLNKKKKKVKDEFDDDDMIASSSRSYNYIDEDMKLMEEMENNKTSFISYQQQTQQEIRYPITDPRKPFVCQHCGVGFAREKALESHVRIHAGDSPFECQKCGEMFWDMKLMREHLRNKHNLNIEIDENDDDIADNDDNDDDDDDDDDDYSDDNDLGDDDENDSKYGTFYCSTCGLSFHRQDNLKRHQRIHVKEEYINDNEFGHVCNVCGESFPEALDLLAHAEVHAARNVELRCMICGELFDNDQSVAIHVQTKHGKNLPANTCMLCGRTCKDRRTLLKHSWEHSKEKSFACSKCGKTFHNKARLKRHMLSHRNKIVTCDVCGDEFPDGRSLMNHRHSHSSISGRQFPCRECGKTFGSRSSQQIHIRIHTGERPYGCRFCWKAFADGGTLRKHERIHTGEKPYACAVCPRAFNQRVVLREHIRSHHSGPDPKYSHSVTPYCCSVCSDMFATSQDLIVHLIHHCDLNTAMRRQPQIGPRKYKRRRKLKPHELEMISNKVDDNDNDDDDLNNDDNNEEQLQSDSDTVTTTTMTRKRKKMKKQQSPKMELNDLSNNYSMNDTSQTINSVVKTATTPNKNKRNKLKETTIASRPKMIHTQKTRIPIETNEDGRIKHKTKTLITRTQPIELKTTTITTNANNERIRPRTKNVSYHILNPDKLPLATFQDDQTEQAVNNLLKEEIVEDEINNELNETDDTINTVVSEQTVETGPVPTNIIKITSDNRNNKTNRHIIGNKVVRIVKGGMIITKNKNKKNGKEPENILPDIESNIETISNNKQDNIDPSPLHELAEISMQHAQNLFKCEMCSAVFSDRAKLLDHVPIHI